MAPCGGVASSRVEVGASVEVGDQVAVIEAMKMETVVRSPIQGIVARVVIDGPRNVDAGDLILVIDTGRPT